MQGESADTHAAHMRGQSAGQICGKTGEKVGEGDDFPEAVEITLIVFKEEEIYNIYLIKP